MECRLRWRLCRSPGILSWQCSANLPTRFQNVVRPWSTITDSPSRRTVRPYSFIVRGGGGPFVSATPGILILAPSLQPSLPLPLDHKSFHDRKSRDAPISSALGAVASSLFYTMYRSLFFSVYRFNDLGPESASGCSPRMEIKRFRERSC